KFKQAVTWLYLLALLHDKSFPVFAGYCQYEPNVLKLTPPLSVTPDEVRKACVTISSVLNTPLTRLVPATIRSLFGSHRRRGAALLRSKHATHSAGAGHYPVAFRLDPAARGERTRREGQP